MPALSLLSVTPQKELEFPARPAVAKLQLTNTSEVLVAYKVKSTASKNYVIKPPSGSIRKGESCEVQIARRSDEEGGPPPEPADKRRPDRFLVQAAVVDTDEKKMLLHAAHRGKTAGAAKFWDGVPKEVLEEKQLVAVFLDGEGAGDEADAAKAKGAKGAAKGAAPSRPSADKEGMPSDGDVDAILSKMTLPGRSTGAPAVPAGGRPPPGFAAEPNAAVDDPTQYLEPEPAPVPAWKKQGPSVRRQEDTVLQKHMRPVVQCAFDPTGKVLFSCSKDKVVMAWSCPDGEYLRTYEGHRGAVWCCSVSPDGALLLSCGADSAVLLWDVETAQQLCEVPLPGVVRSVEWHPSADVHASGQRPFAAAYNSFAKRPAALVLMEFGPGCEAAGSAQPPQQRWKVEEPTLPSSATQVAWAGPGSCCICTVHPSGEVLFWSPANGDLLERLQAHTGDVSQVSFPVDRSLMATCGRKDMYVRLWELPVGDAGESKLIQSHLADRSLNAVALRHDLLKVDIGKTNGSCYCLAGGGQDARDVALVGAGSDDQFDPILLQLGPDVDSVMSGYTIPGTEGLKAGGGHFGPIHHIVFSMDGSFCISSSEDGNVRIRDLNAQSAEAGQAAPATGGAKAQPPKALEAAPVRDYLAHACEVQPAQRTQPPAQPAPPQPQPASQAKQPAAKQQAGARQATQAPQQAAAPPGTNRVVAIHAFDPAVLNWPTASQHRPLPLLRGQEIEVVRDLGDGWAYGQNVGQPQMQGLFPMNYTMPMAKYWELMRQAQGQQKAKEAAAAIPEPAVSAAGLGPAGRGLPGGFLGDGCSAFGAAGGLGSGLTGGLGAPLSGGLGSSLGGGLGGGLGSTLAGGGLGAPLAGGLGSATAGGLGSGLGAPLGGLGSSAGGLGLGGGLGTTDAPAAEEEDGDCSQS